jgi:hypothetical protein
VRDRLSGGRPTGAEPAEAQQVAPEPAGTQPAGTGEVAPEPVGTQPASDPPGHPPGLDHPSGPATHPGSGSRRDQHAIREPPDAGATGPRDTC